MDEQGLRETLERIAIAVEERTRLDNEMARLHLELHERSLLQYEEALDLSRQNIANQRQMLAMLGKLAGGVGGREEIKP